jgi:hypothetical protein
MVLFQKNDAGGFQRVTDDCDRLSSCSRFAVLELPNRDDPHASGARQFRL